jgi:hypothetical protein
VPTSRVVVIQTIPSSEIPQYQGQLRASAGRRSTAKLLAGWNDAGHQISLLKAADHCGNDEINMLKYVRYSWRTASLFDFDLIIGCLMPPNLLIPHRCRHTGTWLSQAQQQSEQ